MKFKNLVKLTTAFGLLLSINGCGSSSPNDQGVAFSLVGFAGITVDEATGRVTCDPETFTNLIDVPFSDLLEGNGVVLGCPIFQNNMTNVTVRTERINLSFFIPGASDQPPSASTVATVVLGRLVTATETVGGEANNNNNNLSNRATVPVNIVPQSVRTWLSQNRDALPNAPFSMDVSATVVGVTSAGDQLTSNRAFIQANVTNDTPINDDGVIGDDTTETPAPE